MKKITFFIFIFYLILFSAGAALGNGLETHSIYKITSYNLGAILGTQDFPKVNQPSSFAPLLITSVTSDILNSEHEATVSWIETDSHTANSRGIAISAQYNATNKIALQGAFGLTRNLWTPDEIDYENESSWEANLGIIYQLLDNLSYEIHFGYMNTGDLFRERSSYGDVESIIMINNRISMSFWYPHKNSPSEFFHFLRTYLLK